MQTTPTPWFVYMILDSDQHVYTGITTHMARRWEEHTNGKAGARYFRGRTPTLLCLLEEHIDRSHASQREYALKRLPRRDKLRIIHVSLAQTHELITRFAWEHLPYINATSSLLADQ